MRAPAVAGRFYPADPDSLEYVIRECFEHPLGPGAPGREGTGRRIVSAMCPHAGYMCSGMTAAHVYKRILEDGLPDVYVVIGPDHHGLAGGRTVLCSEDFLTPFGPCRVDEDIVGRLAEQFTDDPSVHAYEHSVEVQVPFIQRIDSDPAIVPIMMGDQSLGEARRLAESLRSACEGRDVVVIASTDMSHYIPKESAARLDGMVLDRISAMDVEGMYDTVIGNRITMCGYGPTAVAMMFADSAHAEVLKHTDSFDSLGMDAGSVVGYGAAVFRV